MKNNDKHVRTVGNIPNKNTGEQFQIEMKNDSFFLFNILANIMTILIDYGPSSSIVEQRGVNDKIAREILGDQYDKFVENYEKTFGKKWYSYKNKEKQSVKSRVAEYKPPEPKTPETKVDSKTDPKKVNLLGEPIK